MVLSLVCMVLEPVSTTRAYNWGLDVVTWAMLCRFRLVRPRRLLGMLPSCVVASESTSRGRRDIRVMVLLRRAVFTSMTCVL